MISGEDFTQYVSTRLEQMRQRPQMFGGCEAVELQALTLIETEHVVLTSKTDREPIEVYIESLRKTYPRLGNRFLSALFEKDDTGFGEALYTVCKLTREHLTRLRESKVESP